MNTKTPTPRPGNVFLSAQRVVRPAAVAASIGFAGIAMFQVALAAGAPWGHAAWGGAHADLSTAQRSGSAAAVVIWAAAALIVLGRAGFWGTGGATLFRWGTWVLAAVSGIAAVLNFASQSRWENFIFGPTALLLTILCSVVASSAPIRGHADATPQPRLAPR